MLNFSFWPSIVLQSWFETSAAGFGIGVNNIGCFIVSAIIGIVSIISGHVGGINIGLKYQYRVIFKSLVVRFTI